jgi:hypothetical protein
VQAGLRAGALGYLLKADAQEALLPGMEAVRLGRHFLSTGLSNTDRR